MADISGLALSPGERSTVVALVRAEDPELADRLAAELTLDPTTRLLLSHIQEVQAEVRHGRWWHMATLAVVVVAMGLNAGLVGVSMTAGYRGAQLEVDGARALPDMDDGGTLLEGETGDPGWTDLGRFEL